ncbi:MAG: nucleoid-associated protein YejK [Haemophilus parainfluenzae]|jgi:nucleoid-associated protein CGSHiGG_07705|uniref:Nucleoid-associated protein BBB48_05280 n=2 Tax=Haemophilus parainfluenzae TaxID=729 RepID=A0AAE7YW54_HAEPA|nr:MULTISPECIES: nucleoid-associated protein YejK [Haemophilus]EGC71466.1 nucleoid-associated protein NdpA [Haemophilus parainfluenzae ATCC 33392]KFL99062.1 nucleoid-associated protein NdpA [Haemophilus parainfluenzae ATCC 33392]MBF1245675.1 nucleoid-associated protein YejK [Haemophilus sp.]MBS6190093.1 nucleoid-associated protein YejK [Haemophilus parainfluenzae]MDU1102043.1 nucleoid-associated protein YejK [Haemophilus parainfluenzae]
MSITVNQIVLHQLVKHAENETTMMESVLRDELLTITPEVEQMMLQLHQGYQNKGKAFGVFQENSIFAQDLNRLLENEINFLNFSQQSTKLLAQELGKYNFADSGTLILCQYNFLATDYLFIALLDSRISMLVDENLEIRRTEYLDITQFDIAARINLTDLQVNANSNRYLTFIKGRVGRKISDFFMDFLGAEEGLNPQVQNQCLLQAVSDYCEQGELNKEQTQAVKKQVFEYCKGQLASGDEIALTELSANLPTLNERPFVTFTEEQDYGLEETIPPVRSALKTLTKFSGSGKGVTLSFDADLLNNRIEWDPLTDTLTIKGIPPNLKDQLQKALKCDN